MNTESGKSYLTKWDCEDGEFNNQTTILLDKKPAVKMSFSSEGFYLGITTADNDVKSVNTRYMEIDR